MMAFKIVGKNSLKTMWIKCYVINKFRFSINKPERLFISNNGNTKQNWIKRL